MGVFTNKSRASKVVLPSRGAAYYFKKLGVSVLFSGAAVGVSHVVQATRAGADFSLALIPAIILCLILKYPAFLFGPLYTKYTGESVIAGYARIGRWTLPMVGFSFLGVMFTVIAAVSLLSSSLFLQTVGIDAPAHIVAIIIALSCTVICTYTSFDRFQSIMKIVFLILFVLSIATFIMAFTSSMDYSFAFHIGAQSFSKQDIFFLAALIGWMPAGLDLPMMHSQWVLASQKNNNEPDNTVEDFNFGYLSTTFLALLFVFLGAIFFYGKGKLLPTSASGFSKELLRVYSVTLGDAAGKIMGVTLFIAIFSSLFVVIDGFPRVLSEVIFKAFGGHSRKKVFYSSEKIRRICSWFQLGGALLILLVFSNSLTELVDFATTLSFILVPIFAFLNHKLICSKEFTQKKLLHISIKVWSLLGLTFFVLFTIYYFYLKIFG